MERKWHELAKRRERSFSRARRARAVPNALCTSCPCGRRSSSPSGSASSRPGVGNEARASRLFHMAQSSTSTLRNPETRSSQDEPPAPDGSHTQGNKPEIPSFSQAKAPIPVTFYQSIALLAHLNFVVNPRISIFRQSEQQTSDDRCGSR